MSIDLPGFADPVLGAQSSFRAILDAMSRPGTIHEVGAALVPPAPLAQATAAVLLTLVDADTALHLGEGCDAARDWIVFHCSAPITAQIDAADFAVALTLPDLATLNAGSDDGPELGATLILQIASFERGQTLHLAGPGLAAPTTLEIDGLPDDFVTAWATNHARFPRGVDIILCAGTRLVALPRSLRIVAATREA
jgi:alpha-D-ribose 1-methylphosphonate 5-triphosphate synthase subunit PhnH